MKGWTIRRATVEDTPTILDFIVRLARYERLEHEVVATESLLRETLFGEQAYAEVLLGFVNDEPVGFALYFFNYSTFLAKPGLFLEDLFVDPAYRGRGFGKSLLQRLAQLAVERNCGRMEWNVLTWNAPAIGFYESLDAKPQEQWQTYRLTGDSIARLASSAS